MPSSQAPLRRRRVMGLALAATMAWGLPGLATAQGFPTKPVTIVVPFSAGGTTDILARIVARALEAELGQPVVVDNKAGAGGNIGAQAAARATPDGHTLLMGTVGTHAINQALYRSLPYKPAEDFAPITRVAMVSNILVAHPSRPYGTVKELIDHAKANPGKVNFASSGNGTSIHLSAELFRTMTQVNMLHVPYKGSAPAVADLLAGQVDIMFDNLPSVITHIKAGKLRPIAVTADQRSPELQDIPTIAEAGVPGYSAMSWFGLFTNRQAPAEAQERLSAAMNKILKQPEVVKQMAEQGAAAHPETPAEFQRFIDAEVKKWGEVVKASGARVD